MKSLAYLSLLATLILSSTALAAPSQNAVDSPDDQAQASEYKYSDRAPSMLMLGDEYDEDDGAVEEKDNTLLWVLLGVGAVVVLVVGGGTCLPFLLFGGCAGAQCGCAGCAGCLSATPTALLPLLLLISGTPEGEFELTELDAIEALVPGFKFSKSTDKALLAPSSQAMAY